MYEYVEKNYHIHFSEAHTEGRTLIILYFHKEVMENCLSTKRPIVCILTLPHYTVNILVFEFPSSQQEHLNV